eukprot:947110-Prymnesium_polylepis.1
MLRRTDMQSAPAMQAVALPLARVLGARALLSAGASREHTSMQAMGLGTRGVTFRGLSFDQRALMVSVVRQ